MRLLIVLVSALLCSQAVSGQDLTLTPRPDAEEGLPASIRVFDVTRLGTSLQASLIRADLATEDWILEAVLSDEGGETVASFAEDAGVYAAINGGYFGAGQSFSLVINDGELASPNVKSVTRDGTTYFPMRGAFTMSYGGSPNIGWVYDVDGTTYIYPAPTPNAPGAPQAQPTAIFPDGGSELTGTRAAIGGGPVLVQDGAVAITYNEEVMFGSGVDLTSKRARTAVGYTNINAARLLLVTVSETNGLTLGELAQLMVDLGAHEALNLDGGGSTAMTSGGADLIPSSRTVISALRLRDPDATGSEEEILFDTGDTSYRETGDWFESANAPFAGGTPSRLNEVGTGEDRAVFTFDGITAGTYTVEAWWTPSGNRATNTPFTVYRGGTPTTVRANQSLASSVGVWNRLGDFELAPGDSLVVTDDASGTGSPTFVCVDAIRLFGPLNNTARDPDASGIFSLRAGPNPVRRQLDVWVGAPTAGPVRVELVDALGRVVRSVSSQSWRDVQIRLDVRGLRAGVYIVRATTADGTRTQPVTVLR
ncbi:MAG: phosphodiester glycosidase family protein [Bacteroidota bacterium]